MALIDCHECSKGISDKAPNCPHCGAPNIYVVEGSEGPSSNSRNLDELTLFDDTYVDPKTMQPYSGPHFKLFPAKKSWFGGAEKDKVMQRGYLLDGQKNGPFEEYNENSQLKQKCFYEDGMLDGPFERYHENGHLEIKCAYKDGERDGPFKAYNIMGHLMEKGIYELGKRRNCSFGVAKALEKYVSKMKYPEAIPAKMLRQTVADLRAKGLSEEQMFDQMASSGHRLPRG